MIEEIFLGILLFSLIILGLFMFLLTLAIISDNVPDKIKCRKCGLKVEDKGYNHILCPRCNTITREENVW